jgi:hypothetical protein
MGARTFADEPKGCWNLYLEFLSFALRTAVTRFMMELSRWHWSLRKKEKGRPGGGGRRRTGCAIAASKYRGKEVDISEQARFVGICHIIARIGR